MLNRYIDELRKNHDFNRKVLLINPIQLKSEFVNPDIAKKRGYYAYLPTGLVFLTSVLRSNGYDAKILDLNYEYLKSLNEDETGASWKRILDRKLDEFKPSILLFSCMFDSGKDSYYEVIDYIPKEKYIKIVGGTHVSGRPQEIVERLDIHFAIAFEGEERVLFLIDALLGHQEKNAVMSHIYFKDNGAAIDTGKEVIYPDIKYMNVCNGYDDFPVESYNKFGSLNQFSRIIGTDVPFAPISVTRGCRGRCTFCSVHSCVGYAIRARDAFVVFSEIEYLYKRGIRTFDFIDDDLWAKKENTVKLLNMIIESGMEIKWYINNGIIASDITDDMLKLMVDSGCIGFKVGIESGNREMLKIIKKPATQEKLIAFSKRTQRHPNLYIAGNYIIGFPNETFGQMLDTLSFAKEMNLDWASFYICQPIKGAEAFKNRNDEIVDYIPVKSNKNNEIDFEKIAQGLDIFSMNKNQSVDAKQLPEVWFIFNFISNFICNKNLSSCQKDELHKFIKWLKAAEILYPYDLGMKLFLYIGYSLFGDVDAARRYFEQTNRLYQDSIYWQNRFRQFMLGGFIRTFQTDENEIRKQLDIIRKYIDTALSGAAF